MTVISASLIKELREKTGSGMTDCKKALVESGGDIEGAIDWLRKTGLSTADKKAGRVTSEGAVIALRSKDGKRSILLEVNSETDFVARNPSFQKFAHDLAQLALDNETLDISVLKTAKMSSGGTVGDELSNLIATLGENITIRRIIHLGVNKGVVASYVHNALGTDMGKIGVLVAIESFSQEHDRLLTLGKQIAMHVAAAHPDALNINDVDPSKLDRERAVLSEQARASGKPEAIIAKMVEGRLRKYYEEVVLLEQIYVVDGESRVKDVVEKTAKEIGSPITVTGFACFRLGEGIEKPTSDFAAEVAGMTRI